MSDFTQSNHIRLVRDVPDPDESIRWVLIADKAFAFTPTTCYKGITANGEDYYPYYDHNLRTIPAPDDDFDSDDHFFDYLRRYTL